MQGQENPYQNVEQGMKAGARSDVERKRQRAGTTLSRESIGKRGRWSRDLSGLAFLCGASKKGRKTRANEFPSGSVTLSTTLRTLV